MTEHQTISDLRAAFDAYRQKPDDFELLESLVDQLLEQLQSTTTCVVELRQAWAEYATEPARLVGVAGKILEQHVAGTLEVGQLEAVEAQRDEHRDDVLKLEARIEQCCELVHVTSYDLLPGAIMKLRDTPGAGAQPLPPSVDVPEVNRPDVNLPRVNFPAQQSQVESLELDVKRLAARVDHVEGWATTEHSRPIGSASGRGIKILPRPALELPRFEQLDAMTKPGVELVIAAGKPRRVHRVGPDIMGPQSEAEADDWTARDHAANLEQFAATVTRGLQASGLTLADLAKSLGLHPPT